MSLDDATVIGPMDAEVIVATALAAAESEDLSPKTVDLHRVTVPAGARSEIVDLERYLDEPRRTKGTYQAHTVTDFIRFIEVQQSAGLDVIPLTVWVDANEHKIVGILNDATPASPEWRDHRVVLQLQHTPEWDHWAKLDGVLVDQGRFAEHLEDGIEEIRTPDAATMLEIAQSFHARTDANFSRGERLQSGEVKFTYTEDTTASAGKNGELEVPQLITLAISPFVGEPAYEIKARFRYRMERGGALRLGYKLERPERILRDSLEQIGGVLTAKFEHTFLGTPAVPQQS